MQNELLREIVRLSRSAMQLALEVKDNCPKATEQAMSVCLEIERLFNSVYDYGGGNYYG